jgi:uncharacterized protein (DUF4415 family)
MTASDTKTYSASEIAKMVATGDHAPTAKRAKEAAPELDRAFWENARVVMPGEAPKVPISMRLDPEVLAWFKQSGKGYLSRMNAVLRAYVEAQKPPHA